MNNISTGVDIVDIKRIEEVVSKQGDRFLKRVFTPAEIEYCQKKITSAQSLAARFAAKEAVFKAAGTGLNMGMAWQDVEVQNDKNGRPSVILHGKTSEMLAGKDIQISLSHTDELAIAFVVVTG